MQDEQFSDALKNVYKRAATEPDFRQLVLSDPKSAFAEIGYDIKDWSVRFSEPQEGVDDVLQLPPAIEVTADLTEEELEAVAGGAMLDTEDCCTFISCSNVSSAVQEESTW